MADKNAMRGTLYEGEIYLQRYVNGVLSQQAIGPLEVTIVDIEASNEIKQRFSNRIGAAGQARGSIARKKPTKFSIKSSASNSDLNGIFLLGTSAALNEAGGNVLAESVVGMKHDKWYKLDHNNVSAVTITGSVLGTDFEVDGQAGMLRTLSTGNLADNATVEVAYTYGAITGETTRISAESKVDVQLIGRLVNSEDGSNARLRVPKMTISPDGNYSLIADDYTDVGMTGEAILLDGEAADSYLDNDVVYA